MNARTRRWIALAGAVLASGGCADAVTNVSPAPPPTAASVEVLSGRSEGISVPGPEPPRRIVIRCGASLGPGKVPLFVVDGEISSAAALPGLSPDEIESLEILKGPAATAIYGTRAASGVVVITTRKRTAPR
jgi:TonB-dependent SusC/RagA subfamily outer membrane receptor